MPGQLGERLLQPGIEQVIVSQSLSLLVISQLTMVRGRVGFSESDLLDLTETRENFNISFIDPALNCIGHKSSENQALFAWFFVALENLKQIGEK